MDYFTAPQHVQLAFHLQNVFLLFPPLNVSSGMSLAAEISLVLALLSTLLRHSGSLGAIKVRLKKRCFILIKLPGGSPFPWESSAAILESCGGEVEGLGLRGVAAHQVSFLLGLCHRCKQKTKGEPTKKLEHEHKDSICEKMAQPRLS